MSQSDTRLFVGRLGPSVQKRDLEEIFGRYGKIINCSLKTTYGFVEFEDPRDAKDAVRELDGYRLEGSRIAVEFSHGRKSERGAGGDRNDRERGGGRERDDYRERERERDRDRDYDRDRERDYDRGDRDRRDRDRDRDYDRDDRRRYSGRGSGRGFFSPPYNTEFRVSVAGLPQGCSWQDLKDHFRQVGEVCYADVRRDRNGKEVGIVEFKRLDDMRDALKKYDHTKFRGSYISVSSEYDNKSRSRSPSGSRSRRRSPGRYKRSHSPQTSRSPKRSQSPKRSPSPAQQSPKRSPSPGQHQSRSPSPQGSPQKERSHSKSPEREKSPKNSTED